MLKFATFLPITFLGSELGVILDSQLSFNNHISSLVSSLMAKVCSINRISLLLDQKTLMTVTNSLVFSKLFHCSCVWAGTSKKYIARLQQIQNFAAQEILNKKEV